MLQMLAPGAVGIVLTKVLSTVLSSQNRPLATVIPIATGLVTTVALDLLLIPTHGGFGAAIASTAAYLVAGTMMAIFYLRVFKLPAAVLIPRRDDFRALIAPIRTALRARRSSTA
jgi:Na+-driven multidrug efflux pump